jgi:hypothetical protein
MNITSPKPSRTVYETFARVVGVFWRIHTKNYTNIPVWNQQAEVAKNVRKESGSEYNGSLMRSAI